MSTDLLTGVRAEQVQPRAIDERASWIRRHRVDIAIVVVLAVVLGVVHAVGMNSFPARFDDEGAYMSQAWAVLARFDLSHYTYWYDHPPLGWLVLAAYSGLTGSLGRAPYAVAAGREAMLLFHLASVALLYVLARRIGLRRPFAVLAVLIFGLSPLGVFFHRMVLLDNIGMPFLLAGFVLVLSPKRRLGAHVAAAALLAAAVLIREIFVLLVPFAIWLYLRNANGENRRYSLALSGVTFFGLLAMYPVFALLRGELFPGPDRVSLFGAIAWQLSGRQSSGSIFDPTSPAGEVTAGWLTLDPWILVLGLLCAVALLFVRRLRWVGLVVMLYAVMLLRPGYLPVMYVLPALPFLALSIGGAFDAAWSRTTAGASEQRADGSGWAIKGLVVCGVAALVLTMGPWYDVGIRRAMAADADQPFVGAQAWLEDNLEADDWLLVDAALWLDVVESGHPADQTIWFYKLDSDPGVDVPGGWEAIDYIVASEVVRNSLYDLPQMELALASSEVVATFGEGEGRVEIRRIVGS